MTVDTVGDEDGVGVSELVWVKVAVDVKVD